MRITISEGLGWMKTLKARHQELVQLRNQNAQEERRYYGNDRQQEIKPLYDVKELDKLINKIAQEIRKLDMQLKRINAKTVIEEYDMDEAILGELK